MKERRGERYARKRERERERREERRDFGTVPCTLQRLPCSLEHGATVCVPERFQRQGPALMLPSLPLPLGSTLTSKSVWISPPPSPPGEATKISGHRGCTNANLFGRGWRVRAPIFPHGNAIFGPGLRIQMRPWPVVSNRSHGGGRDTGKGRKFNELWKGR